MKWSEVLKQWTPELRKQFLQTIDEQYDEITEDEEFMEMIDLLITIMIGAPEYCGRAYLCTKKDLIKFIMIGGIFMGIGLEELE